MKLLVGGLVLAVAACESNSEPASVDPRLGERAYQKCYSCHSLEPGKNDLTGPTLHRIVGRPVATQPGFDYSPALRRFAERDARWTVELIDRYIADPNALVPGTNMTFHGISDERERAALIVYLERH